MVQIEGTYTILRKQEYVDFWVSVGLSRSVIEELLGTHWTLRVWSENGSLGIHFECREVPSLNLMELFSEGGERRIDHILFGGKAKVSLKKTGGDGFVLTSESESLGKVTREYKVTEEELKVTVQAKGKSLTEKWDREEIMEGDFILEKGENIESYFKSVGESDLIPHMRSFKVNIRRKGKMFFISESYGEKGIFSNSLILDSETPIHCPSDKSHEVPSTKAVLSRLGVGKYSVVYKSKDGMVEEWKFMFSDRGLELVCTEKKSGQTCKLHMKRFVDLSGSFKIVSTIGLRKFVQLLGLSPCEILELEKDSTAVLLVTDKGHGRIRFQLIREHKSLDISFKLDEEFAFYHPLVREVVRCVPTLSNNILCLTTLTSRGTIRSLITFNDSFVTWYCSLPEYIKGPKLHCKMIFERLSHDISYRGSLKMITSTCGTCGATLHGSTLYGMYGMPLSSTMSTMRCPSCGSTITGSRCTH